MRIFDADVTGSLNVSGSSNLKGGLVVSGSQTVTGSLTVHGNAKLGDQLTDTHTLTGSLRVTGSLSGSLTGSLRTDYVDFNTGSTITDAVGRLTWNPDDLTLNLGMDPDVTQQIGQELYYPPVFNGDSIDLINGTLVMVDPNDVSHGDRLNIIRAVSDGSVPSKLFVGVLTENIDQNEVGFATWFGLVRGLHTADLEDANLKDPSETWFEGTLLYASPTIPGGLTSNEPTSPHLKVTVAAVTRLYGNNVDIMVRPDLNKFLGELNDVNFTSVTDSNLIVRSGSQWVNSNTLSGSYVISGSLDVVGTQTINGNQIISGSITITQNISVLGTSSFVYVTSSNLNLTGPFIYTNIFEPVERFGGLVVFDSGSESHLATASLLWDSTNNHWIYQNASGSNYSGGMLLSGPRNTGSLGDELGLTYGRIAKSVGGDHLDNSNITDNGSKVSINSNTEITGSLKVTGGISGLIDYNFVTNVPSFITGYTETQTLQDVTDLGNITTNDVTARSFIVTGGAGHQFLKADGTLDDSTYLTTHPSVVAASSSNNSGRTYIQDILLDQFGHITGITTASESVVNNDIYVTGATFNNTNGIITLTKNDGNTVTVDIDGRYLTSFSETDTLSTVTARGNTTTTSITVSGLTSNNDVNISGGTLTVYDNVSGSTVFAVDGTNGRLFAVTDDLSNSLFSVNTISGLPVIEAFADYHIVMGRFNQNDFYLGTTGEIGMGTLPVTGYKLAVDGNLRATSFVKTGGTSSQFLKADGSVDSSTYLTAHPSVSASASSNNSGRTYIQDILLDSFGHITGITTATETVVDTDTITRVGTSGNEVSGTVTFAGSGVTTVTQVGSTVTISTSAGANTFLTGATFNTSDGVITLTKNDGNTVTVDIDGRFLTAESDTLDTVADRGNTTNQSLNIGEYISMSSTQPKIKLFETDVTNQSKEILVSGGSLYIRVLNNDGTTGSNLFNLSNAGAGTFTSTVTATSIIKSGGTSAQFLMADGSVSTNPGWITAHPAVSATTSVNNSGRTYIQDILLDQFGHITGITSATETVVNTDTNYYVTSASFNTGNGIITLSRNDGGTVTVDIDGRFSELGHTHDDRYLPYEATSDLVKNTGWYTIAVNNGNRASGKFLLRDTSSGNHQSVVFYATHFYGNYSDITVLINSYYSGSPFRSIRIVDGGTYDGALLQVQVDLDGAQVKAWLLEDIQNEGWIIKDWIDDGIDPGDVPNFAAMVESPAQVDLDNAAPGGIITTGNIYGGGDTTQYLYLNTNNYSTTLDGRYYTETEIGNFFGGTTAITGYNKSNWDTAYNWGNHGAQGYATTGYVTNQISNLIDSAPGTLDTLNELAAAINDDPNFYSTITGITNNKVSKSGDTMTGRLTIANADDNKLVLRVPLANGDEWNYIDFVGSNGVRDAYFGTNASGTPTWYRDDNGLYISLGSVATVNGVEIVTNSGTWGIDISGNAATVTNGVYTNGSYSNPSWITALAGSKITGNIGGSAYNITQYTINQNLGTTDSPTFNNVNISGVVQHNTSSTRDKIRLYNNSDYTIGMQNSITYGGLNNDWGMTFQFNDDSDRGFWWGDTSHSTAQGAMALTTDGNLTVARRIRVGYGESDTTTPNVPLQVYGSGSLVFDVQGSQGQLFSVTDNLSGSLFSVNDISGLPILEVNSDDSVVMGRYNQNDFVLDTNGNMGMGNVPVSGTKLKVTGNINSTKVSIGSANYSYDLYNNGTTYLNGTLTMDDFIALTDSGYFVGSSSYGFRFNNAANTLNNMTLTNADGHLYVRGNVYVGGNGSSTGDILASQAWVSGQGYITGYVNLYTTGATFDTGNGIITFTRNNGDTYTVDIDGRFLTSYTETDTLATVTSRGSTMSAVLYSTRNTASGLLNVGFSTAKTVIGNIHIQNGGGPANDNSNQAAITFQGDDSAQSQAGIYVLNNGSYGTSMGFAVTESYGTGPQIFMTSTNDGVVNFVRQRPTVGGNGIWHAGDFTSTNISNWNTAYGWGNHASVGYITGYTETDTLSSVVGRGNSTTSEIIVGAVTVQGSISRGTYVAASKYVAGADNIVLKGNSTGVSGIFFESEKDGTNINHPSDFGFIQFHPYGIGGTSGESNRLVIGVSNDSDDFIVLNPSVNDGIKVIVGSGTTENTVWHSGNLTNLNQLTNGPGYLTAHPAIGAASSVNNSGRTYIQDITLDSNGHVTGIVSATETVVNTDTNYYVTSAAFNTSNGIITLTRNDGGTVTVDIDGKYAEASHTHSYLPLAGGTLTGQLNLHAGSYEGSIVFGSQAVWRTGIRQHDDGDAEMRIWAKNANGMIFISTGYDGEPADIARPTDGLAIQGNKLGIGNFSAGDPSYKLHVKGDIYADGGSVRVSGNNVLYFETHGGGWYMQDSTWIRSYGGKQVYIDNLLEIAGPLRNSNNYDVLNSAGNAWVTVIARNSGSPLIYGSTFYDFDDNNYYLNPASTSNLATVKLNSTADGTEVFTVDGINGRLFTITDDLSDSLFSVNTIAGLPVIEAFADYTVVMGRYGQNDFKINGADGAVTIRGNTVWHAGNDGSGSGLDADLLDGQHGSYYASASSLNSAVSNYLPLAGGTMTGTITITNTDIRSNATSDWTGDPGAQGKIQYHSNRWYIVSDSSSNRIVQFRQNGSDRSYIANDGTFHGNVNGNASTITNQTNSATIVATTTATADRIVLRDGSGHMYANYILGAYFNASSGNSENPTIGQIWTQNTSDDYLRKSTPTHFISQLDLATVSYVSGRLYKETFTNVTNVTIAHGLDTENVIVQVYDENGEMFFPSSIRIDSADSVTVTFVANRSGKVVIYG